MDHGFRVAPEIAAGLADGKPIVALESALITHGFDHPANLHIARRMSDAVRAEGALPAVIALLDGEVRVGLSDAELERLARASDVRKLSVRDLPAALAQRASGGTTVAATITLAERAGLGVFATGGIGGVHCGHPEDVSADLPVLARTPMVVVSSGAKAILDLPRTLEYLETQGVPVIGYGTDEFPAFLSRGSGLPTDARADSPAEVVGMARACRALGISAALLVCVPVPEEAELPAAEAEAAIASALLEAEAAGVTGGRLTPFLLARMVEATGGRSRLANEALLIHNAQVAARIARALHDGRTSALIPSC